MPLSEIYVLFPDEVRSAHGPGLDEDLAREILNTWTVAWHPSILARLATIPQELFPDALPDQLGSSVILMPATVASADGALIESLTMRGARTIVVAEPRHCPATLFRQLELVEESAVGADIVADFFALGYATLQIVRLARRQHFAGHCDTTALRDRCVAAARTAHAESKEALESSIRSCFDALRDIRHQFYPVDIYLLDWTLGRSDVRLTDALRMLESPGKRNVTFTGRQLQQWDPAIVDALRSGLVSHELALAGLEENECALPMWPADVAVREIQRGLSLAQQYFGKRPTVYARRRFGLSGRLPLLLSKLGYDGAVHATLDAGRFPQAAQPRTQWYGIGCTAIDAAAGVPLDRRKASTLLQLFDYIGASIDRHYVATVCLAGWLDENNPWYEDLRRACQWAPVVGKLVTWGEYLQRTSPMGQHADFSAGEYLSPYLSESVRAGTPDPITRWGAGWSQLRQLEHVKSLIACRLLIRPGDAASAAGLLETIHQQQMGLVEITELPRGQAHTTDAPHPVDIDRALAKAARSLGTCLTLASDGAEPAMGQLLINPTSRPLRLALQARATPTSESDPWPTAYARHVEDATMAEMVLDLPAFGYRWIPASSVTVITHGDAEVVPSHTTQTRSVAREWELENEFLRVRVDPATGGLAGLYTQPRSSGIPSHHHGLKSTTFPGLLARGQQPNLLSQRLFFVRDINNERSRSDPPSNDSITSEAESYGTMVADEISIQGASSVRGAIVTSGHFVRSDGSPLGQFQQRFELWRGMRHVTLEVTIQLLDKMTGEPWRNYVASRVAWPSAAGPLSSVVQEMIVPMKADRFDSPLGYQIGKEQQSIWVQTMGLPFHRRVAPEQCDTLLIVEGELTQTFRMRLCVDPLGPLHDAIGSLDPPIHVASPTPEQSEGWFYHWDARNVFVSDWRPVVHEDTVTGMRVRLWEPSGQLVKTSFRAARPFRFAQKCDFLGQAVSPCPVVDGIVQITLSPFEWTDLECHW